MKVVYSTDLSSLFFHDLKKYNVTNFKCIEKADLSKEDAMVHKALSSVVTRFFIFQERHPEISAQDMRILYFKLRIDAIARYFAEYPASSYEDLRLFQYELQKYAKAARGEDEENDTESIVAS